MMKVSGDEAVDYDAVSLDNYANVNEGPLKSADEETGAVYWLDKAGETKCVSLGSHRIRIIRRHPYGR